MINSHKCELKNLNLSEQFISPKVTILPAIHNASKTQPLSGLGMYLTVEEHEQKQYGLYLLVAQRQRDGQFQHGESLVYAGRPANWLMVGAWWLPH